MILNTEMLKEKYKKYANPKNKISSDMRFKKLYSLVKGYYETNKEADPLTLCSVICGISYVSFETALSYYGMIPEAVYTYTSATYNKRKNKRYVNSFGRFYSSDVPSKVFYEGIESKWINDSFFLIASKEKALCDLLYKKPVVKSQKEMKYLLFEDLRIDEDDFKELNFKDILSWQDKYMSTNINYLCKLIRRYYYV